MENVPEKTEKSTPPGVAIDGTKAKNIREAKKFTQLYVANVVGVTTDTISRWENNRYPSIRRDNAEKLVAAGRVAGQEIKWLIPGGGGPVTISYTLQVPVDAGLQTTATFTGAIVVGASSINRTEETGGDREITVAGIHWADRNGDGRIDDNEIMPAYYLTEEMKGLGLDWNRIEAIWSGKGYTWDRERNEFVVT